MLSHVMSDGPEQPIAFPSRTLTKLSKVTQKLITKFSNNLGSQGIDKKIEETAKSCSGCQLIQAESSTAPVHPRE